MSNCYGKRRNAVKIGICTLHGFYPFPSFMFTLWLLLWVLKRTVALLECYRQLSVSEVLCQKKCALHVGGVFFPPSVVYCSHCYTVNKMRSQLSSLACSFVLHLFVTCVALYMIDILSLFLLLPVNQSLSRSRYTFFNWPLLGDLKPRALQCQTCAPSLILPVLF